MVSLDDTASARAGEGKYFFGFEIVSPFNYTPLTLKKLSLDYTVVLNPVLPLFMSLNIHNSQFPHLLNKRAELDNS